MKKGVRVGKRESGHVLVVALIVLALGSITIGPLLSFMQTGMRACGIHEEKVCEFYALEAGLEDAINRIWLGDRIGSFQPPESPGDTVDYSLVNSVNGYQVDVEIEHVWPLEGLESDANGTALPQGLTVVGWADIDEGTGTYTIEVCYDDASGDLMVDRVAAWLPAGFSYVQGSASGIADGIVTDVDPTMEDFRGGTKLCWDMDPEVNFEDLEGGFEGGTEYPIKRVLTFEFTPTDEMPKGVIPWVRTTSADVYSSWDAEYATYKISVTARNIITGKQGTTEAYVAKGRPYDRHITQIQGDYRAIGNSLMIDRRPYSRTGVRDTLLSESSATIEKHTDFSDLDLPADAQIEIANLYWSAWWHTDAADTNVTFELDDGTPETTNVAADKYTVLPNKPGSWAYSCSADVTSLVTEISDGGDNDSFTITVGGVDGDTRDDWSYAGWSLVLIYSSPSEDAHQLYLYDDFLFGDEWSTNTLQIEGFQSPEDSTGRLTCFVGEGDECWVGDYIEVNGTRLSDPINPEDNVWNGKSNGLGGEFIDGVDIDTFDVSAYISPGDTSATVELGTGVDSWNMVYAILSFRSDVTAEEWDPYPMCIITY